MPSTDKIYAAADALELELGKTPTVRQLHDRVGGSNRDIGPALNEWKRLKDRKAETPEELLAAASRFAVDLYHTSAALAERRYVGDREALRQEVEAAQSEAEKLAEDVLERDGKLRSAEAEAEAAAGEIESLKAQIADLTRVNAALERQLATETSRSEMLERLIDKYVNADERGAAGPQGPDPQPPSAE